MCSIKIIIFLLCLMTSSNCYKILVLLVDPGKSHFVVFRPFISELYNRKHNITFISHFSLGITKDDYFRENILVDEFNMAENAFDVSSFQQENLRFRQAKIIVRFGETKWKKCQSLLSGDVIQNLMKSAEEYDLIVLELFASDCFYGIVDKFRAPVVGISSTPILPWHNNRFGNIDNPSYIPNSLHFYTNRMSFWERLENFLVVQFQKYYYDTVILKNDAYLARNYLNRTIVSLDELISDYSNLLLVNTHFTLNFPRPLVPNVVEIGGMHLTEVQKLPLNIEKFINESTHGVIYFSLGSMIKGHTFPQDKREEFLRAFARLPQRVLWKWENETMPGKPDNVMIQKWMPQFDILSHPNVKAFISHGGLLGTTEAVHCGVPMLVMPQYGDQHTNARAIEANGGGVILYLKEATEEKVYQSLKTILDPEFRAKAKALSERFRDRPMSPMDTAIYWVEYVARHKGAPHLRTAAVDMPLYQYLLLDVIAFLAVILIVFTYMMYKILSVILRALFSKKKVKQS